MNPGPFMPAPKAQHPQYVGLALCTATSPLAAAAPSAAAAAAAEAATAACVGREGRFSGLEGVAAAPAGCDGDEVEATGSGREAAGVEAAGCGLGAGPTCHGSGARTSAAASAPAATAAAVPEAAPLPLAASLSVQGLRGGDRGAVWAVRAVHGSCVPLLEDDEADTVFVTAAVREYPPPDPGAVAGGQGGGGAAVGDGSRDLEELQEELSVERPIGMWRRRAGERVAHAASDDPEREVRAGTGTRGFDALRVVKSC